MAIPTGMAIFFAVLETNRMVKLCHKQKPTKRGDLRDKRLYPGGIGQPLPAAGEHGIPNLPDAAEKRA